MNTARYTDYILLLALSIFCATSLSCAALEDEGPEGRRPKKDKVECFYSFAAAKKAMHTPDNPKLPGHQWHHIVGQHKANVAKFGARNLHCTDNLVYLTGEQHRRISAHYMSKTPLSKEKRVYEWLAAKSFDQQYAYGVDILHDHGVEW